MKKLSLFFILILFIVSCQKDNKLEKSKLNYLTDQEIISKSKAWYEATIQKSSQSDTANNQSFSKQFAKVGPR